MPLIAKFLERARRDGMGPALKKVVVFLFERFRPFNQYESRICIDRRRIELSKILQKDSDGTVSYGPFKGLKLQEDAWWGRTEIASILLGLYEKEILDALISIPSTHRTFIDLGAADGYYGIGVLINNMFQASHCYEISELGRSTIRANAELNNVEDRVRIHGIAKPDFYSGLKAEGVDLAKCVLLCDIEGAEFDLLCDDTFEAFQGSIILIEIHDFLVGDGLSKLQKLKQSANRYFSVIELTTGARDLSGYPVLKTFHDNDRWLICSEGRAQLMTWLKLEPK
jgi:hypothetical protein